MKKFTLNNLLIFLFLASALALISAYISQYYFDYQPCILCLYQRKPFFIIIAIVLFSLAFFKSKKSKKIAVILCALALLINSVIAIYHVGVEQKIYKGLNSCHAENLNEIEDLENLKLALESAKTVRCDEPQLFFLGLTMAAWNIIFCLFLFLVILFNRRLIRAQVASK